MARFVYRMQSVLNIKQKTEGQVKMEFAEAQAELNRQNDILNGYISDALTYLEGEGFHVRSDVSYGNSMIRIQRESVSRVFSNLLSNIMKYAKRDAEVLISCRDKGGFVEVQFINAVRVFEEDKPESTGFGYRIITRLMSEMNGEYSTEEKGSYYISKLRFQKVPERR